MPRAEDRPGPPTRRYASVVGPGTCDDPTAELARAVGYGLAEAGFVVVTGGRSGAMEAASQGAHEAGGTVLGILPGSDRSGANRYASLTVVSAIGHARNLSVVASGDVVVAVGGSWGTLSEIGLAGTLGRPVVLLGGWGLEHADGLPTKVTYADTAAEAVEQAVRLAGPAPVT